MSTLPWVFVNLSSIIVFLASSNFSDFLRLFFKVYLFEYFDFFLASARAFKEFLVLSLVTPIGSHLYDWRILVSPLQLATDQLVEFSLNCACDRAFSPKIFILVHKSFVSILDLSELSIYWLDMVHIYFLLRDFLIFSFLYREKVFVLFGALIFFFSHLLEIC